MIGVASASPSLLLAGVYAMSGWAASWAASELNDLDVDVLEGLLQEKTTGWNDTVARGYTILADTYGEQIDGLSARIQDMRDRTAPLGMHCPVCVLEPSAAYGSSVVLVRTL